MGSLGPLYRVRRRAARDLPPLSCLSIAKANLREEGTGARYRLPHDPALVSGRGRHDNLSEALCLGRRALRRVLIGVILAGIVSLGHHRQPVGANGIYPRVLTYYTPAVCAQAQCWTYSGVSAWVVPGAAACGWSFPLWTRLRFEDTDVIVTCIDRGAAWHFYSTEVDLFVRDRAEGEWLVWYLGGRAVEVVWD